MRCGTSRSSEINSGRCNALDATTGNILWNVASGGTVLDGPSIVDGGLYWGSGFQEIDGTGNNKVLTLTLTRKHSDDRGERE